MTHSCMHNTLAALNFASSLPFSFSLYVMLSSISIHQAFITQRCTFFYYNKEYKVGGLYAFSRQLFFAEFFLRRKRKEEKRKDLARQYA